MKPFSATSLMLAGAVSCGALAAWLTHWYVDSEIRQYRTRLSQQLAPEKIVVATGDLAVGDRISAGNAAVRPVPRAFIARDAVRPEQFAAVEGKRLAFPVNRGEPILYPYLSARMGDHFSARIEPGRRATTFQVDEVSSQSGMIAPGDRVDLLVTLTSGDETTTFPLLTNVTILATGNLLDRSEQTGPDGRFRTVTMVMSPKDAARVAHARATGTLTVVVRSPGDENDDVVAPATKRSLLGLGAATRPNRRVEIILGGR